MRNRKNDIERYLRGELSAAEMHALEKAALNDPFLAEALEGIEQVGHDSFLYDLHELTKSVHRRTRTRKNKTIKMWGWTVGIAASVILIAVSGFLVISLLKSQKSPDLAMKETESASPVTKSNSDTIASALQKEPPVNRVEKKPLPEGAIQQPIPVTAQRNEAANDVEISTAEKDKIIATEQSLQENEKISAAANPEAQPRLNQEVASVEKESAEKSEGQATGPASGKRASEINQTTSGNKILTGKVASAEDGTPLQGVNVLIKETNIGTVTDAMGNYELLLPSDNLKLVFSFIGFKSTEVQVVNQRQVNVQLPSDASQLSEVIVTGFGATGTTVTNGVATRLAEPSGGNTFYKKYLLKEVKYPEEALKNKTEGNVTIAFTVEPDGQLTDFQVIQGLGAGCEDELIRVIKQGPAWKPTTKDNVALRDQVKVRFRFIFPKK